jgi:hypothetical protein
MPWRLNPSSSRVHQECCRDHTMIQVTFFAMSTILCTEKLRRAGAEIFGNILRVHSLHTVISLRLESVLDIYKNATQVNYTEHSTRYHSNNYPGNLGPISSLVLWNKTNTGIRTHFVPL